MGIICNTQTKDEKNIRIFTNYLTKFCEKSPSPGSENTTNNIDTKTADFISIIYLN